MLIPKLVTTLKDHIRARFVTDLPTGLRALQDVVRWFRFGGTDLVRVGV